MATTTKTTCPRTGTAAKKCSACGAANLPDATFCHASCGAPFTGAKKSAPKKAAKKSKKK